MPALTMGRFVWHELHTGDRARGGLLPPAPRVGGQGHWLEYVAVESVDEATKLHEKLGAQVHVPPSDIPNVGRFSIVRDPTGGGIALFTGSM
jgi:predicted enzyme related to lactoylglutathione lyase